MRGYDGKHFDSISADTEAFPLVGGLYQIAVLATFGGGNVVMEQLGPDEATWLTVTDPITANGGFTLYLPPGKYRINLTTATGVTMAITRVPVE